MERDEFVVLDGLTRCGRMFLGLGSLLTGCKVKIQPHSESLRALEHLVCHTFLEPNLQVKDLSSYPFYPIQFINFCFNYLDLGLQLATSHN